MRILQVSHVFMPESAGGTEVHTHLLSKALSPRHEIAICYRVFDKDRTEHELISDRYDDLPVYKIVNNFTWSQGPDFEFFDPGLEIKFEAVLDAEQPDLVHFQHLGGGLSTSFPALVRRRGVPMILTLHDHWPMCYRSHLLTTDDHLCVGPEGGLRCVQCWLKGAVQPTIPLRRRVREVGIKNALRMAPRYLLDLAGLREYLPPVAYHTTRLMARDTYMHRVLDQFDILLAPSQFLKRNYELWGVSPEKLKFIQNGIDPSKFADTSSDLPMQATLQAVFIGSILKHKGLDVLVDAFNGLVDVPISLRIHGNDASPAVKDYVRALRAKCHNPRVTFEGAFPNHEIGRVLSEADLIVLPSILYENCPMVILEAFYAGRPVVTSNIGGMAELVHDGVNGRTFRVGDAAHLAERLRELATDRSLLPKLAQGIERPQTMADVAQKVECYYQELVAGSHCQE